MSPITHINTLFRRVRYEDSASDPDNSTRNIVLAVIFSILGTILVAVGLYFGMTFYRNRRRRENLSYQNGVEIKEQRSSFFRRHDSGILNTGRLAEYQQHPGSDGMGRG
jgi:hypothetical protein